jgi:hypothetical protein
MEKFLLIIREDLQRLAKNTPEEERAERMEMHQWTKQIIANDLFIDSNPLKAEGRYVSGNQVLSDGPFIESKEGVSGYYVIKAKSLDDAVRIAQGCPLLKKNLAVIEVRPLDWTPKD